MAKKPSLRDLCIAQAPARTKGGPAPWIDRVPAELRPEIQAIVNEWIAGGEIRKAYPSKRALHRWIITVPGIDVSHSCFTEYMLKQEQGR